jgi:hypothetical protein
MAESFVQRLRALGIEAEHRHFENLDHIEIIHRFAKLISGSVLPFLECINRRPEKDEVAPAGVLVAPTKQIAVEGGSSPRDKIAQRKRPKHAVRTSRRTVLTGNS